MKNSTSCAKKEEDSKKCLMDTNFYYKGGGGLYSKYPMIGFREPSFQNRNFNKVNLYLTGAEVPYPSVSFHVRDPRCQKVESSA